MPGKDTVTYEERRQHIYNVIYNEHDDLTLRQVCEWCGRDTTSQYQYVWQVLSGDYGKSKRSPTVLDDLESELQKRDLWIDYEV